MSRQFVATPNSDLREKRSSMPQKLTWREIIGYGMGDFGSNMVWGLTSVFLMFFYTDVFGLTALAAGVLLSVARVLDAGFDLISGMITEHLHFRWGKFRTYLLFGPIPMGLLLVLSFTTPPIGATLKLFYAYATYILLLFVYSATNTPYGALATTMTQDAADRNSLSSARAIGAIVGGGLIVGMATPWLVSVFGHGHDTRGFQLVALLFAVICILAFWITFVTSKENYVAAADNGFSLRKLGFIIRHDPPFLIVTLATLLSSASWLTRNAMPPYYVTYNLGRPEILGWFLGIGTVAVLIGIGGGKAIIRFLGKRNTMMIGNIIGVIAMLIFYFTPFDNLVMIFALQIVASFGGGIGLVPLWSMLADTVEYGEWRTGFRAEGGLYSVSSAAIKIGWAASGALPALILGSSGYLPNQEQPLSSLVGINVAFNLLPAFLLLAATGLLFWYHLDEALFAQIVREL